MPFGSIGTAASRWFTIRCETTTSASSRMPSTGPVPIVLATFDPCSSWSERRVGLERGFHVGDRGQRVVVDDHGLGRVERLRLRLGDDHRDDVADEADLAARERRPVHRRRQHHEAVMVGEVEVAGGVHGDDAGHRPGVVEVDRLDPRVRDRRPDERDVQQPVDLEVVEILRRRR